MSIKRELKVTVLGTYGNTSKKFSVETSGLYGPEIRWLDKNRTLACVLVDYFEGKVRFLVYDKEQEEPTVIIHLSDTGEVTKVQTDNQKDIKLESADL